MHWIYGGAWTVGSNEEYGTYDAKNFAEKNEVVVVAGNYRLDIFGWLALDELQAEDDAGAYGNYGLMDQTASMEWTQRNVAKFGGDPNKVTIFGESAGGFSVCQHIVRPASNKLFSQAIMESGDCDGPWLTLEGKQAKKFGETYAKSVGCEGAGKLACLRKMPLRDIMEPYVKWLCPIKRPHDIWCQKPNNTDGSMSLVDTAKGMWGKDWPTVLPPFAPIAAWTAVVDGSTKGIPDDPYHLIKAGKINTSPTGEKISVIMGTNHDEMALFLIGMPVTIDGVKLPLKKGGIETVVHHLIAYHNSWNQSTAEQILAQFPSSDFSTESERFVEIGTDFVFRCGTRNSVQALTKAGVNAYLYSFEYHGPSYKDPSSAECQLEDEVGCGVFHSSELKYVFGNFEIPHLKPADHAMSKTIQKYWTNLAKYGNPNGPADPAHTDAVDVQWPLYATESDKHLLLANPVVPSFGLKKKECDFLTSLPAQGDYPH
jgi:carboxylesterase type B